ncbi:M56 family metallopeptidase [uncultured Fibrella sp.]|uniref:M56 family metallopeptidase n=1 Tax=uncultured Fibrella sp. TaxID=1284596 RepID=UPI0035CA57C4
MTTYLLKSVLCMLVLLGVYRFWLEQEPMHRLKRLYLLGTLLLSLAGPFLSLRLPWGWLSFPSPVQLVEKQVAVVNEEGASVTDEAVAFPQTGNGPASEIPAATVPRMPYWLWLYGAITAMLLLRFARNLYVLVRQIRTSPTEPYYEATLVKLPVNGLPYTFLHYLFVSAEAYDRGEIEAELVDHELAHIRQRHSLDVLLVEIVLCFCWFNPLLVWLRGAIQRNHEFLADQVVNETYLNVPGYQHLLLSKVAAASPKLSLTSPLPFQTTKQRLLMMTKQTSTARTWLAGCSTALFFAVLTMLLTSTAPAQQTPVGSIPKVEIVQPSLTEKQLLDQSLTVSEMEKRFGLKPVKMGWGGKNANGNDVLFKDLTPEQKARVVYIAPDARKTPTEAQWLAFKNPKKYGVWIDSKRRRDNPLSKYKRTDIVTYWSSFVYKNARQPEGYLYQLELYTEAGYQQTLKEWREQPLLVLETKEMREKRQARTAK